jgi:hypothetical protein
VRRDDDGLARLDLWQDLRAVIRQGPCRRILQALTARRRRIETAAPDVDLLLAPLRPRVILIEPRKIAIVALVQRLVAMRFEA